MLLLLGSFAGPQLIGHQARDADYLPLSCPWVDVVGHQDVSGLRRAGFTRAGGDGVSAHSILLVTGSVGWHN